MDRIKQDILRILILFLSYSQLVVSINYRQLNQDEISKQYLILHQYKKYYGQDLFQSTDQTILTINHITVQGWFFLRCSENYYQQLFSIEQQGQLLIKVSYNYNTNQVQQQVKSIVNNQYASLINVNAWFFIKASIFYSNNSITGQTTVHTIKNFSIINLNPLQLSYHQPFYKNDIILTIGNPTIDPGINESCAFSKNIFIYWDYNIDNNNLNNLYGDYSALDTQLIWNLDFFYSKTNPNSIINTANPQRKYINQSVGSSQILTVKAQEELLTDYVNISDFGGITISFHFKLASTTFTFLRLFSLSAVYIDVNSPDQSNMNNQFINGVSYNQWNQVTIVIKSLIDFTAYYIITGLENQALSIPITQFTLNQIQLGKISNDVDIHYSHIRYYKGTFLTLNEGNCYLQASRVVKSCIICNSNYLINYQSDSMECTAEVLPSKNVKKDNLIDWNENHTDCPSDMVYNANTKLCDCMYQFYKAQDKTCKKCPNYCKGCTDSTTCIEQDKFRKSNGECDSNYFDDGYTCIKNKLTIFSRDNKIIHFVNPQLAQPNCSLFIVLSDYILTKSQLNLDQSDQYSFFYSFSYVLPSPLINKQAISTFKDGTNEIFTISYEENLGINYIYFLVFGQLRYRCQIVVFQGIWFSLWTDMKQVVLFIQSLSEFFSTTIDLSYLSTTFKLTNPSLCVGACSSNYLTGYLCGNPQDFPWLFIRNITNPISDLNTLKTFFAYQVKMICYFSVDLFYDFNNIYKNQLSPNLILNFQGSSHIIDRLKGFGYNKNTNSVVQNININGYKWISFYCTIFPVTIESQVTLLYYQLGGDFVQYLLVPIGQQLIIRICYLNQCKDSQYSKLNMNESSTLFIIMRQQTTISVGIHLIEFEVVCNFQRELIQFLDLAITNIVPLLDVYIGTQSYNSQDFLFYLNGIHIDNGNGLYYFDYSSDEPCFIFAFLDEMKCIRLKKGYIYYKGQIITEEKCQSFNEENKTYFIITPMGECLDTWQQFPDCKTIELINNIFQCLECKYQNQDPNNNCQCLQGYQKDSNSNLCTQCNPACSSCSSSSNNCIQCQDNDQQPPNCDCKNPHYFLNQMTFKCEECSSKCETCFMEKDSCITCASKRANPPYCNCDQNFYIEQNNECLEYQCDAKCLTCKHDQNDTLICNTCKPGRLNPPSCDCETNYYENKDGTCSQCSSSFYYDKNSLQCLKCEFPCQSCEISSNNCTFCLDGLQLVNSTCKCDEGYEVGQFQENQSIKYLCAFSMEVRLQVSLKDYQYLLTFTFDHNLIEINFSIYKIQNLLAFHLSDISPKLYSFSDPEIKGNKLTVKLNVFQSFQTLSGMAQFPQNSMFISNDKKYVLNSKYSKNPIPFEIGPYIFTKEVLKNNNLSEVIDLMKNEEYQNVLKIVQQSQILFYFLNTAQPTTLFLLLKANFPPNLYQFYQMFGLITFPDVVDYLSKDYKEQFEIFGYKFNQTEVKLATQVTFKRIGFSNSLIINATMAILKYASLLLLIITLQILVQANLFFFKIHQEKLIKLKLILLQKINGENETNLLLLTISILHQFTITQQDLWAVRYGYYISITFIFIFTVSFLYNYREINSKEKNNPNQFSISFTERLLQNDSKLVRNYFLIQMIKKYLVIVVIFCFQDNPFIACLINGIIFLSSSFITLCLKPYTNIVSRTVKILGEQIFSTVWFLHIIILNIEDQFNQSSEFAKDLLNSYLNYGNIIIILLFIFNLIFLSEYFIKIYYFFKELIQKKQSQKKKKDIFQNNRYIELKTQQNKQSKKV